MPLQQATREQAAVHLLLEMFLCEHGHEGLEEWHWINEADGLSIEEWREIGRRVWQDTSAAAGAQQKQQPQEDPLTLSGEPISKVQQAAVELRDRIMQRAEANRPETEAEVPSPGTARLLQAHRRMAAGAPESASSANEPVLLDEDPLIDSLRSLGPEKLLEVMPPSAKKSSPTPSTKAPVSQDEETEEESIHAELLRRSMVRQRMAAALSSNSQRSIATTDALPKPRREDFEDEETFEEAHNRWMSQARPRK